MILINRNHASKVILLLDKIHRAIDRIDHEKELVSILQGILFTFLTHDFRIRKAFMNVINIKLLDFFIHIGYQVIAV